LLILYTFYKNVLYVTTQFFFGFWSAFSGQPLYEPMIYQLYNITMTSLPIMYYALFDFEHEKDFNPSKNDKTMERFYFMKHPHLYRIGIEYQCFGILHFLRWVCYGLCHAMSVYMFCFHLVLLPGQALADGKDIGFWVVGHVVYGACVMTANLVIMFKFNNYTGWGEILCLASMLAFFTLYFLENLLSMFPQVYLIFDTTFIQPAVWASIALCLLSVSVFELFYYRIRYLNVFGSKKSDFEK